MIETHSFYTSGGTLGRTARSYVTRRADEALLDHLLKGDFCYVLTSRQMGKSSLMVRTADALRKEGVNVAILDLTRIGQNVTLEQWYDGLLVRLGAELDLEDELDDYSEGDRAGRLGPMQRFMSALRDVVLPSCKGNVAIFVDEIDCVRSLPFSSDEFFAGIRECYNSRVGDPEFKRLAFCLLGVAQPSDLISNVYITPFNIGHRIELTDFTEKETKPLLEGLKGKSEKPDGAHALLHRILHWTGGHPYLTQKLCETVEHLDKEVTPKDVDLVCEELFLSSRSREQQDNLIFVRDRVLASKEQRSAILDLYAKVLRGERVRDDDSNTTIDSLRLSGLLVVSNGYLKVRNRIYATVFDRHWITANMPDAELRRQKAAYRRGIALALAISLPVLAIIVMLGILASQANRLEVREHFFQDTAAAQQAFDGGDYKTGNAIVDEWTPQRRNYARWWSQLGQWWQQKAYGQGALENSFPMRLLRAQKSGESAFTFPRGDETEDNASTLLDDDGKIHTSCDAEMAVATTVFNGRPLIAAGGVDSSVQIWDSVTKQSIARLQLSLSPDGKSIEPPRVNALLPSCDKLQASSFQGVMSLSFSPDGSELAISTGTWRNALSPGSVLLWNLRNNHVIDLQAHFKKTADSTQFSYDGHDLFLAASSEDATAQIWKISPDGIPSSLNIFDPRLIRLRNGSSAGVGGSGAHQVALSAKDHWMALGYGDGHLVIYDYLKSSSETPLYAGIADVSGVMSLIFLNPRDKDTRLVIGSRDGELLLMDPRELIDAYTKGRGTPEPMTARKAVKLTLNPGQGVLQGLAADYNDKDIDNPKTWLLTSGGNGTIGLWSVSPNLHLISTFRGHANTVYSAAFCQTTNDPKHDPGCIVSASADRDVRIWRYPFRDGEEDEHLAERRLIFNAQMLGVAFADKQTLVTAVGATTEDNHDHTNRIAIWNFASDQEPREIPENIGMPILGFAVSPDGNFLVSTSRDRNLVFVDLKGNAEPVAELVHVTLNPKIRIRCLDSQGTKILPECLPDQREYLVMGVADRSDIGDDMSDVEYRRKKYDQAVGLCMWRVTDHGSLAKQRFSIDEGFLNPCETPHRDTDRLPASERQDGTFRDLARTVGMFDISADGETIATSLDANKKTFVKIWETSKLLRHESTSDSEESSKNSGFGSQFANISFSPDGRYLAATTIDAKLYYWPVSKTAVVPTRPGSGKAVETMKSLSARGQALVFDPDPRDPILAIGLQDSTILLWSTKYYRDVLTIHQHTGGVLGLAFSPDGKTLASSGNDGLVVALTAEDR